MTIINDQYPVLTSSRKGIFFQKDYYDGNQIASENNIGYNIVPYGYFTYRHMSDDEIFYFNINNIIDNGIVSTLYPVFTTNNRLDSKFLQYELNFGKEFRKYSVLQKQGGSRTYMYFNKLRDLKLTITTSLKEQECIRNLICCIDHLITLHQSKSFGHILEVIVSCTLSWEQRKLGECFTERIESMPNGELISVTINDGIKKFSELGRHDNSNDDKSKYKKVCVGDIAYNSMRMWQGASGYSPYEGIVSPAYTVLAANHGVNSRCIAHQFKLSKMIHTFKINSQGITSDNWNLKFPTLSDISIYISRSIDEQGKIASLLESLDHLITLHQLEPFQLIFKAIAYRIIDYAKSKPPRCRKYTGFIAFINTMYKNCVYTQYNHLYSLKSYYIKDIILLIKSAYICKIII